MLVKIDRFEEDLAVLELDGRMLNAPRELFAEAKEGDTVELKILKRENDKKDEESPSSIFARLRRKSRRKDGKKPYFE